MRSQPQQPHYINKMSISHYQELSPIWVRGLFSDYCDNLPHYHVTEILISMNTR
jgi:hypothetical protein